MNTFLFWVLAVLVLILPCYLWYWLLFRRVLLTRMRYLLFSLRDELRILAATQRLTNEDRKAYPLVEMACNRAIRRIENISISHLLMLKPSKDLELIVKRDLSIVDEASKPIRAIHSRISEVLIATMAVNAPGLLLFFILPLSVMVLAYYWFNRARQLVIRMQERLWETLANEQDTCLQDYAR